jgi:hypothetical protein
MRCENLCKECTDNVGVSAVEKKGSKAGKKNLRLSHLSVNTVGGPIWSNGSTHKVLVDERATYLPYRTSVPYVTQETDERGFWTFRLP